MSEYEAEVDTTWVYLQTEPELWTVGYYSPSGVWHPESDHGSRDAAAARVSYLNGGAGESARRQDPKARKP